ncbi:MAG TPA: DUF2939 domain-containing protein [Allosphingosinicella sp.]|jgi:hypothetical protein
MTRNKLILIAAAVVALAAGWYFGSPRWTLYQMAEAAEDRDGERLAGYIDFPVLRETSKAQIKAQLAVRVAEAGAKGGAEDGFAALGAMLGMAMIDPMIDGLLTPEAMQAVFARAPEPGAAAQRPFGADASDAEIIQEGLGSFRLRRKGAPADAGDLIFRRHGLGWKLSEIRIPADLMKDAPTP